jgi:hypothetical protein
LIKHEVLGAAVTVAAINSIGFGYIHSLSPLIVLNDIYIKIAQFGGFLFFIIPCIKVIGMSYMLITTAQFPASFPALSHFKKKKKKKRKKIMQIPGLSGHRRLISGLFPTNAYFPNYVLA